MDAEHQISLGYALVQHLTRLAGAAPRSTLILSSFAAAAMFGCAAQVPSSGPEVKVTVFVAPSGADDAPGTREQPFRTIGGALAHPEATEISLAPGDYAEPLVLDRAIQLLGPEAGGATLRSPLRVSARRVELRRVALAAGADVEPGAELTLAEAKIAGGDRERTITVTGARLQVAGSELTCGLELCLEVAGSTVTLDRAALDASGSKRALRAETSSVSARALTVTGGELNQVLARRGTRLALEGAAFSGTSGAALAVVEGAELVGTGVIIDSAAKVGLLVDRARATLTGLVIRGPVGLGVGATGAEVTLDGAALDPAPDGALSAGAYGDLSSNVRLRGGVVRHGRFAGVMVSRGELVVDGTRFEGDGAATGEGAAIVASSADAVLTILGAQIDAPAGFGVILAGGASGTVTATITRPGAGGIYVDAGAGAVVGVHGSRIEGCRGGSGIVVLDSTDVTISGATIIGCPEAGVLAGLGSTVIAERCSATGNRQYAFAAFGGSSIEVRGSRASGSRWAAFASCGDGARVEDGGGNTLVGAVTRCP